jgi:hypothetical protein
MKFVRIEIEIESPALFLVLLLLSSCSLVLPPVFFVHLFFSLACPLSPRTFFPLPLSLFLSVVSSFSPFRSSEIPLFVAPLSLSLAPFVASPLYDISFAPPSFSFSPALLASSSSLSPPPSKRKGRRRTRLRMEQEGRSR